MSRMLRALLALVLMVLALGMQTSVASASYPGRDGKLVLVRANQIYTINADGSELAKLTSTGKNYRPHWSPNGARIAYMNETSTGAKDVWVMKADGTSKQRVTRLGTVTAPASWSPDGQQLAFASSSVLMKVKATSPFGSPTKMVGYYTGCEGCDPTETTPQEIWVDRFLAWSPDGRNVALYNQHDGYFDDAMYMYDTTTGEARQVRAAGGDCCGYVDWTDLFFGPTGTLGYSERDLGDYGDENNPSSIRYSGFVSRAGDTGGAPSPSGRSIAFTNATSGSAKVYVASASGTGRRVLTSGYQPDWQPVR